MLIRPDGRVREWYGDGWIEMRPASRSAWGSGRGFAMGAMMYGASAEQAVKIACGLDNESGEPVMTLTRPAVGQRLVDLSPRRGWSPLRW